MGKRSRSRQLPKRGAGIFAAVLVFLWASAFLSACNQGRKPEEGGRKITIAVTPWPASASVYIAREKGYFREEGLDATLQSFSSGHLGLAAVLAGKADFATASETPITRAALDARPFALIATVSSSDRAYRIVARKDRGISTPRDLVGKKVGRVAGTGADFFLDIFLTTSYVDPKGVRIVHLEPDGITPALLRGDVDAVCTWPPSTNALMDRLGGNAAVLSEPGLHCMTWNIVAARSLAQGDPDVIVRFLRAIVRANRLIEEHPGEARSITAKNTGMDLSALEREWDDYHMIAGLDQGLLLLMEDQARWMIARGISAAPRVPNFLAVVSPEGLRTVLPESVVLAGR